MQLDRISTSVFQASVYLWKLAYINLIWILLTLSGLVVFGIYPATVAMLTVIRQLSEQEDLPILRTFWTAYKKEWTAANKLGLFLTIGLAVLYADSVFFEAKQHEAIGLFYYPAVIAFWMLLMTGCYAIALQSMYKQTTIQLLKNGFLMAISMPVSTFMLITGTGALLLAISYLPWLLVFYAVSLWGWLLHFAAGMAIAKTKKKQTVLQP